MFLYMKQLYLIFATLCALGTLPAFAQEPPVEQNQTDTVDVFTGLFNVKDMTAKQGVWMIQALDYEQSDYEVVLVVKSKTFVGSYTPTDVLYVGNNATPLTCIYPRSSETGIAVNSAHGIVYDEGAVRTFDFYLDAEDGKVYHLLVSYEWYTLEFDADTDFSASYSSVSLGRQDGGVALVAANAQSQIGLLFYVADPTVAEIPAGTYTFSADKTPGTVLASLGVDKVERILMPSYIGTIDAEGKADEMWFLVSGKVVVEEADGLRNFTIDALNSKGKSVQVVVSMEVTALEDIEADAQAAVKTLHNGRVVIVRDGRMYEMNGNPVTD